MDQNNSNDNPEQLPDQEPETSPTPPEEPVVEPMVEPQQSSHNEPLSEALMNSPEEHESWGKVLTDKKFLKPILGALAVVLVVVAAGWWLLFSRDTTPPVAPQVQVAIEVPSKIITGQNFDFKVSYANQSDKTLQDISLSFVYPEGFGWRESDPAPSDRASRVYKVPDLSANQNDKIVISGALDGQIGDKKTIEVQMRYRVAGFSTYFTNNQKAEIEIGSPDLTMDFSGPSEAIAGQEIVYTANYRNITDRILRNVLVTLNVPSEFQIEESFPKIGEENVWLLGDIAPGVDGSVRIKGFYRQPSSSQRVIEVSASLEGSDDTLSRAFTITSVKQSPLVVSQRLEGYEDGRVPIGSQLRYVIDIENRGSDVLTNLIISNMIDGNFDLSSIQAQGAAIAGQTITWSGGGVPELKALKPGQTVSVDFQVSVVSNDLPAVKAPSTSRASVSSFEIKEPVIGETVSIEVYAPNEAQ